MEKFCVGPTRERPGPILLMVEATAVKFVIASKLSNVIIKRDNVKIAI